MADPKLLDDEELLLQLELALAPIFYPAPRPEGINHVLQAVAAHGVVASAADTARATPKPVAVRARSRLAGVVGLGRAEPSRWRRRWTAVALAALTTTAGSGVAFAAGAVLPEPLRVAARTVGLPVDSPAVTAVRQGESELRRRLDEVERSGATAARVTAVTQAAALLSARLVRLDPGDRARVGAEPGRLLDEAALVARRWQAAQEARAAVTGPPPSPASPASPAPGASAPVVTTSAVLAGSPVSPAPRPFVRAVTPTPAPRLDAPAPARQPGPDRSRERFAPTRSTTPGAWATRSTSTRPKATADPGARERFGGPAAEHIWTCPSSSSTASWAGPSSLSTGGGCATPAASSDPILASALVSHASSARCGAHTESPASGSRSHSRSRSSGHLPRSARATC